MDHRDADKLLEVWRRQARRRKLISNALPLLFGIAVWVVLGSLVLIGFMRFGSYFS